MLRPLRSAESGVALGVIPRVSLKDTAVQRICEAIEGGELKPGEQITELGLAKKLGVAQPTIREALLELEFAGFVEPMGPRKTRVTVLSRAAIDDIYLVRTRLETLAVELIASQPAANLASARSELEKMETAARKRATHDFWHADLAFHRALWQSAGSESLRLSLERLVPKLFAFAVIRQARPTSKQLLAVARSHRRLLEQMQARDVAGATQTMVASMESARMEDDQLSD
jgi:DNA-binding GntR family transcriptional regulator